MSFSRCYFKRITPTSVVLSSSSTGSPGNNRAQAPPSQAQFIFSVGKNSYADMTKSFFLLTDRLRKNDGNKIDTNIYRVFNHPATLFSTHREFVNNSLVCSVNQFTQVDTLLKRNIDTYSKNFKETIGELFSLESDSQKIASAKDKLEYQYIFKPDASSLFQISELYSGEYKIEQDIQQDFFRRAIDTPTNVAEGASYLYDIVSYDLYVYIVEDAVDYPTGNVSYFVQEPRGFTKNIGPDSTNENIVIKVEPSIKSLLYALQVKDSASDTSKELTKFIQGSSGSALFLDRLQNQYIVYNGENIVSTNRNQSQLNTNQELGHKYQAYINSIFNKSAHSPCGSAETWNEYKNVYGAYYHYQIPNDAANINQQLDIYLEFQTGATCDIYATLLHTAKISINYDANGNIVGSVQKLYVDNPNDKLVEVVKQVASQPSQV